MAQKGTFTAYQQLDPISTDFGQIARTNADKIIAQQERANKQREKDEAKQAKVASDFAQDYGTLGDVITETKSIDEAFSRGINGARDMMGSIYKQIQSTPTLANDVGVQLKLQNLRNYSKNLKVVSDRYTEYAQTLSQGIQDGSASNWNDDDLNSLDSIYAQANLDVRVDPTTGLPIAATIKLDRDGNPLLDSNGNKILQDLNLQEVLDGRGLGDIVPVYEMAAKAQEVGPDLGKRTIKNQDGSFSHIEYQQFSDIEPEVRQLVKGLIGSSNNPTNAAKSIWSDTLGEDKTELDQEDMTQIENAYVNTIKAFYDETAKKTSDFSDQNTAAERARKEKESKKDGKTKEKFTVVTGNDGKPKPVDFKGLSKSEGFPKVYGKGMEFSLPVNPKTKKANLTVLDKNGEEVVINRVFLLKSDVPGEEDTVAYSGFKESKKGDEKGKKLFSKGSSSSSSKKAIGGGLDENDPILTDIAKAYGLDNQYQLKTSLQESGTNPEQESLRTKYKY